MTVELILGLVGLIGPPLAILVVVLVYVTPGRLARRRWRRAEKRRPGYIYGRR